MVSGEELIPFHTSRRHIMVDHLKTVHKQSTTVAIRTTEILMYGHTVTKPWLEEIPRGPGLSWCLNSRPTRLWLDRQHFPSFLLNYPHYTSTLKLVASRNIRQPWVTLPGT